MQNRISFLRAQAEEFRRLAASAATPELEAGFFNLAASCEEIAANIERNLPIHQGSAAIPSA
jgi:hypothetical protein